MTQSAIDLATFEALKETAGADFAVELVATFLTEAPRMLDDLRDAFAKGDADRFRRAAHSLKSNANTFGALQLGVQAKALELGGLESVRTAKGAPIETLAGEYALAAAKLGELARG